MARRGSSAGLHGGKVAAERGQRGRTRFAAAAQGRGRDSSEGQHRNTREPLARPRQRRSDWVRSAGRVCARRKGRTRCAHASGMDTAQWDAARGEVGWRGMRARACAWDTRAWHGSAEGVDGAEHERRQGKGRAGACTGSGRLAEHGEAGCAVGLMVASHMRTGSSIPGPWRRRRGIGEAFVCVRERNAGGPGPPRRGEG